MRKFSLLKTWISVCLLLLGPGPVAPDRPHIPYVLYKCWQNKCWPSLRLFLSFHSQTRELFTSLRISQLLKSVFLFIYFFFLVTQL